MVGPAGLEPLCGTEIFPEDTVRPVLDYQEYLKTGGFVSSVVQADTIL